MFVVKRPPLTSNTCRLTIFLPYLSSAAIAAGRRLADRLFGPPGFQNAKVSYENVPTVIFSHPPIGTIGLTEDQAIEKYGKENIKIYRSVFSNLYYGTWQVDASGKPKTAMKLVCAGKNELVVGLHVIGMGKIQVICDFRSLGSNRLAQFSGIPVFFWDSMLSFQLKVQTRLIL